MSAGKDTVAFAFYQQNKGYVFIAAICGSLALVADYIQNLAGFKHASVLTGWIETTSNITRNQLNDHTTTFYSVINSVFFIFKNACCIIAATLTAVSILNFVLR
jgi:hypothetical protein